MGRRWGKTVFGFVLIGTFAARGGRCAWVVPQFKNGRPLWRMLRRALAEHSALGLVRISETERTIEFGPCVGGSYIGGFIGIYTGDDNCDAMRGEDFDLVVLDEAAKLSEAAVYDTILPTLADRHGKLVPISTPRGRNWFWREWMRGQDESQRDVRSFKAPSADNPNPMIQQAARKAKDLVSERTYNQEWLAEFLDDGGGVFHNVRACIERGTALLPSPRHRQARYVCGVDLAKLEDYTVALTVDLDERRMVGLERWNRVEWPTTRERLIRIAHHWNDAQVWLDSTGVGSPIYDDLRRAGVHVFGYQFTYDSKIQLTDNAVLTVEQQQIALPDPTISPAVTTLINELEAYEYEKLPSGRLRTNAPGGMHDDCVMAFGLACWGLAHGGSVRLGTASLDQLTRPASERAFGGTDLLRRTF